MNPHDFRHRQLIFVSSASDTAQPLEWGDEPDEHQFAQAARRRTPRCHHRQLHHIHRRALHAWPFALAAFRFDQSSTPRFCMLLVTKGIQKSETAFGTTSCLSK